MIYHTFTATEYGKAHNSYADAVFYAQCTHDTTERPKISGGIKLLRRTYIATARQATGAGFEFPELLKEIA
jgi:hypothetical protein